MNAHTLWLLQSLQEVPANGVPTVPVFIVPLNVGEYTQMLSGLFQLCEEPVDVLKRVDGAVALENHEWMEEVLWWHVPLLTKAMSTHKAS